MIEKFIKENNLNKPTNFNDLLNLQDFYNKKIIQKKKEEIPCYRELDIWDIRNCILDEFQEFKRELPYEYNFKTYRHKAHNPEKQLEEYVDILNFILCKILIVKENYSEEAWQDFASEALEKDKKTLEKMIINFEYYATQAEFFDFENRYVYPYMIDYYLKIGNFFNYTKEDIYNQYWKKFLENCKRESLYD